MNCESLPACLKSLQIIHLGILKKVFNQNSKKSLNVLLFKNAFKKGPVIPPTDPKLINTIDGERREKGMAVITGFSQSR